MSATVSSIGKYGSDTRLQAGWMSCSSLVGLPDSGSKYPAALLGRAATTRRSGPRARDISGYACLLDEPLSALDAKVRVHLRHEIKELQRQLGVTTVMVTHDQEEALSMADRIVVMNHGVIEQVGTPTDIYSEPAVAVRRRLSSVR